MLDEVPDCQRIDEHHAKQHVVIRPCGSGVEAGASQEDHRARAAIGGRDLHRAGGDAIKREAKSTRPRRPARLARAILEGRTSSTDGNDVVVRRRRLRSERGRGRHARPAAAAPPERVNEAASVR